MYVGLGGREHGRLLQSRYRLWRPILLERRPAEFEISIFLLGMNPHELFQQGNSAARIVIAVKIDGCEVIFRVDATRFILQLGLELRLGLVEPAGLPK